MTTENTKMQAAARKNSFLPVVKFHTRQWKLNSVNQIEEIVNKKISGLLKNKIPRFQKLYVPPELL